MAEILLHSDITQPRNPWKPATTIHDRGVVSLSSGLEAPRNSIDFPLREHDHIITMRHRPFEGSIPHNIVAKKKLIHKQMPSQPSVIARLMGMDTIPIPAKDAVMIQAGETGNLKPPSATETELTSRQPTPFKQSQCSLRSYRSINGDYRHCLKKMRLRKSRRSRHPHPQKELLQKVKEGFQAWQTSKVLYGARTVAELGRSKPSLDGRYVQILAQGNLRKEKMARYGYGSNNMMGHNFTLKDVAQEGDSEIVTAKVAAEPKSEEMIIKVLRVTHSAESEKCRPLEAGKGERDHSMPEKFRAPTRIVILKPSSELGVDDREPLFGSSKVKNMEVKERLKKELKVKARSEARTPRGTDPKQIAKQIREAVTKDLGKRLSRSESFRAFRSERKRNAAARHASPEHAMVDTRDIAAHRMNSVSISRTETASDEKAGEESFPIRGRGRVRSPAGVSLSGIGFDEQSGTSECLAKHKVDNVLSVDADVVSPRALVRSLSAPASGISHVRLFLEDYVGSRKNGTSDIASEGAAVASRSRSFSFSLRGTVSSLRRSFSLGGKLLGRKMHWSKKPLLGEMDIGTTQSSPQGSGRFTAAQANFTELPPSPVSPLEVEEGRSSRHFFGDLIDCTFPGTYEDCKSPKYTCCISFPTTNRSGTVLNVAINSNGCAYSSAELSPKCSSELGAPIKEPSHKINDAADTESNHDDKAYVREVLITAGLCDDDNKANAGLDPVARPICDWKVSNGDDEIVLYRSTEENATDHRMLFDLANEALQVLVGSVRTASSLHQWVVGMSRGRKLLLDDVWQEVQSLRNPPTQQMQTIESMVACEVRKSAWAEVLCEDVYVVGRKIERAIFDELIGGIVHELFI